ncbi:squalene synthase HpnC [Piscinibacter terrae]|uniref:Squalene synthase HpnC n=1 Tax=Piscinibacter terrae TaxID=2496871 RepID=A0A3N7HS26_9BURK|nr:squalene synthase HpnC [Albitalea terrae]
MHAVSVDHYENFPVASVLCPPRLRPAVAAIYWFARTADDIADEGDASPAERLAALAQYRAALESTVAGQAVTGPWQGVFGPLAEAMKVHHLPPALLRDLLSAFEQDVVKHDYADRAELLDYCRRSANPVGRLLLHLYGVDDDPARRQSDAICTALQLINFWQDLGVDTARGRLYPPMVDVARHGVTAQALLERQDTAATRALVADLVRWSRELMLSGAPLAHRVPGRAGWELRLVVQGGLRILDRIEGMDFASIAKRPTLRWFDVPLLFWRALCMRPAAVPMASKAT